ncbi:MAG: ABC transporter ATP-binding protein/permease [Bacilli bacterium]|nr:ABC transporter ATP-binding protein/permease [Bacilli bacterium]
MKNFAPKGTLKRLLKDLFKKYKFLLIIVMVCLAINAATNFSASIFIKNFTDTLTEAVKTSNWEEGWNRIIFLSILLGSIYLLGVLASLAWNLILVHITQNYLNETRIKMFSHMEKLPIRYFDTHKHGDIMSMYTNDTDTLRQLISQALPTLFSSIFALLGIITIMLIYSVWLALIVLAGGGFMILTLVKLGGTAGKYFAIQQKALGAVEGSIEEGINGLKVIKVFSHEELSIKEFDEKNDALYHASSTGNKAGNIMMPINGNIGNFIYILCSIVGAVIFFTGAKNVSLTGIEPISIGIILSFLSISRGFTNNVNNVSQNLTFVVSGMAGTARILALLDEPEERDSGYCELVHIKYHEDGTFEETKERTRDYAWKHPHQADGSITYTELKGDIVLEDVTFGYNPDKIVLRNVNIYARPGQKIALVGATGAGKTTITNLLNRFYHIDGGKIRYDGINITKIKKHELRSCLGIVLQDVNLFSGTVMDNIRYGRLDATDEECIEAAKIANAHDFITRLPKGYDTELTGDGGNLSQGQRQLLSIARAAVADTPVLILDEATSSIDTRTEKLVQEGMDKLMEGRTVFVIAHRLSTIQNSDAIMVMDHGQIIERGNHESLIAQKGVYYQLYTGKFELE